MLIVATAGHVDHGKSTLLRALTGMEPDRWAEERRRGLTIDLGFVWTALPDGGAVAFVDVPGHERFVPNMLSGVAELGAVLFVVAADEGWRAQSEEHLAALDAYGVPRAVLVVTRSDLADPEPARAAAVARLAGTSLAASGPVASVAVSAVAGTGLDELRRQLAVLARSQDPADPDADVRLWLDRSFSPRGAGAVVTGTLVAGSLAVGDRLQRTGSPDPVTVRGLQSLGRPTERVRAPARVAVNLRGLDHRLLRRGDALLTPGAWRPTRRLDVLVTGPVPGSPGHPSPPPATAMLHLGTAALEARVRPLGEGVVRLTVPTALPLRVGDRGLLRDPGGRRVLGGVRVLDVEPPELRRRGGATRRAEALLAALRAGQPGPSDPPADRTGRLTGPQRDALAALWLRTVGLAPVARLRAGGSPDTGVVLPHGWRADPAAWDATVQGAVRAVARHRQLRPLAPGMPDGALAEAVGLPDRRLLPAVVEAAGLARDGSVVDVPGRDAAALPPAVQTAVAALERDLAARPFRPVPVDRLRDLRLGPRELAAAARAGRLELVGDGIALLPGAVLDGWRRLQTLEQPFTVSAAREALDGTRRVALAVLARLDAAGGTVLLDDGTRHVVPDWSTAVEPARTRSFVSEPGQDGRHGH